MPPHRARRSHRISRLTVAALAALALAAAPHALRAQGQPPAAAPAAFGERLDVRAVELEVTVTDAAGAAVPGLGRGDFRVLEDGRPVELLQVVAPAMPQTAPAAAAAAAVAEPARLVVVLDELHTTPAARRAVYRGLGRALRSQLPRQTSVMLLRYDGALHVLQPFGSTARVQDALDEADRFLSARAIAGDIERQAILDAIRDDSGVHSSDGGQQAGPCLWGDRIATDYRLSRLADARALLAALDGLVGALDGWGGRKALLYVGDGVSSRPGEEALDLYVELCGGGGAAQGDGMDTGQLGAARLHRPDPQKVRMEALADDMNPAWAAMAARANGLGVTVHTLAVGSGTPATAAIESAARGPSPTVLANAAAAADDVAVQLTETTGGARLFPRVDLAGQMGAALRPPAASYRLAWAVPAASEPRTRRVLVTVDRPGVHLRYRDRYAPLTQEMSIADRLLAALLFGLAENPFGARLEVTAARARIVVPLSRLALLPTPEAGAEGLFTAFLAMRDAAGALSSVRTRTVPVRVAPGGLAEAQKHDFVYEVRLPPGDATALAVALRDEQSGDVAVLRAELPRR